MEATLALAVGDKVKQHFNALRELRPSFPIDERKDFIIYSKPLTLHYIDYERRSVLHFPPALFTGISIEDGEIIRIAVSPHLRPLNANQCKILLQSVEEILSNAHWWRDSEVSSQKPISETSQQGSLNALFDEEKASRFWMYVSKWKNKDDVTLLRIERKEKIDMFILGNIVNRRRFIITLAFSKQSEI